MTDFTYDLELPSQHTAFVDNTPILLKGGMGNSYLPGFISTQVDRSIYGATEGSAGRWAFGTLRTPQRALIDWMYGWDPDVATKIDPEWNVEKAKSIWGSIDSTARAAIMYKGGQALADDILSNSVSQAHFIQRIDEVTAIAKAQYAIDQYDNETNFLTYGLHKTFSGAVNYIASDPTTPISFSFIAVTAGLGAGATTVTTGAARAGVVANVAGRYNAAHALTNVWANYGSTLRTASYLWNGLDGASTGYSMWDQMENDGYRIYGKTYKSETDWTKPVIFGATLGIGFTAGIDALGRMLKPRSPTAGGLSSLENAAASSPSGSLGTVVDAVSQSRFRTAKSRLETLLDTIVGPDDPLRRRLLDDDARASLFYGSPDEMDELSDWIQKNNPNVDELGVHVSDKAVAAERNRAAVEAWTEEVGDYVAAGGNESAFFRKKAFDFLRSHMGDEFAQYRFVVDYLEEASGDIRIVAEWMARGDKDRVIRVVNAINSNKRVSVLEDMALNKAMKRISDHGMAVASDEAQQAVNRINDNITQGRFRGAIDILNQLHSDVLERHGKMLGQIDADINHLNRTFQELNDAGFDRLDHFKEMVNALREARRRLDDAVSNGSRSQRNLNTALSPDADNATVMHAAQDLLDENSAKPVLLRENGESIMTDLKKAYEGFKRAEDDVAKTLDDINRTRRSVTARTTVDGLSRTMEESGSFPLWKVELTSAGFDATHRSAARQTQAGNRWKVEFVDRFLGEGAADRALSSGTNPLRPIARERAPMRPLSALEQDNILRQELEAIAPEIAKTKAAAKDMPLDAKIADINDTVSRLEAGLDKARRMRENLSPDSSAAKGMDDIIAKRERLVRRFKKQSERLQSQLDDQVADLNKDMGPSLAVSAETIRADRANAKVAAHKEVSAKLSAMTPEELASKKGRNLRTKVRKAAAEVGSDTEYAAAKKETDLLTKELEPARARVEDLKSRGSTDADPAMKVARAEVEYLEGSLNKANATISKIEGRPAMIKRSHALNGNAPPVSDAVELSRLRAQIAHAVEVGEHDFAEELNRRLYAKFGDANNLPRWTALEEWFLKNQRAAASGAPKETLISVAMDGRNVKFSVMEATQDAAERAGVAEAAAELPTMPTMSSRKAGSTTSIEAKAEAQAMRDAQMLSNAMDTDPEAIAARIPDRKLRYEDASPSSPVAGATTSNPTVATNALGAVAEKAEAKQSTKILELLGIGAKTEGERLLITNAVAMAMGRIPALRGLGRALLRAQAAGTGFHKIHGSHRVLDMMVTAFNMLDRPEALIKSLGENQPVMRTFQAFRDRGKLAVNELAAAEVRARRAGHYTVDSDMRLQTALDSGDTTALNAGEREMYDVMRRHYDEVGANLEVTNPGTARPNYRPRHANTSAMLARMNEAQGDFARAYSERMRSSGNALPNQLADEFGVPRGTSWTALTPAQQTSFATRLDEYANELAADSISNLTGGVVENGIGYRRASNRAASTAARTLEDEVANNPNIRRWYIQSATEEHKLYMTIRAPEIYFNAQLSRALGTPSRFDDVLDALYTHATTITDSSIRKEFQNGVDILKRKWDYHTGRAQYANSDLLDPALRVSTGLVRGSAGAFWGLAGLATEVPRSIAAARMYGGSIMDGIVDFMHALKRANNIEYMQDIAHAFDQYTTHSHSSFGSSIGTTMSERFIAPWERVWHVATGSEAVTSGGQALGRVRSTLVAAAEAYGETGMRLGLMQYFSGVARIIADRQAKRYISRNIGKMEDLAARLRALGPVTENTAQARAAFKQACDEAGIGEDVAIHLNHAGMLNEEVLSQLRIGLQGQDEVFEMGLMRGRVNDRAMGATMDFLTAAHGYHVPTASLAQSVEVRSAHEKMFYNLTSYSRAFATNVAFRTAANGRIGTMASTFAAVAIGENIYQTVRNIALGKETPEDISQQWGDNPVGYFMSKASKTPWLGAHNAMAMAAVDYSLGINGNSLRGNNIVGPMFDKYKQLSRMVFTDSETGERDYEFLQSTTPLYNTWYSRLMFGQDTE